MAAGAVAAAAGSDFSLLATRGATQAELQNVGVNINHLVEGQRPEPDLRKEATRLWCVQAWSRLRL